MAKACISFLNNCIEVLPEGKLPTKLEVLQLFNSYREKLSIQKSAQKTAEIVAEVYEKYRIPSKRKDYVLLMIKKIALKNCEI